MQHARVHQLNHIHHPVTGAKQTYNKLKISDPARWATSMANELGRLATVIGTRMPSGTETIFYIKKSQIPSDQKATYANAICDYRPNKSDPWQVRLTVGGDKLEYPGNPGAPAAFLLDTKLTLNSVISTPGARFLTTDIKDYFLNNPMERYEYMKIRLQWIPQEIVDQYNLMSIVNNDGYVYVEIGKGMYGLKQAACIAYDCLVTLLAPTATIPSATHPDYGSTQHALRYLHFVFMTSESSRHM
jgi:hypothetical protein